MTPSMLQRPKHPAGVGGFVAAVFRSRWLAISRIDPHLDAGTPQREALYHLLRAVKVSILELTRALEAKPSALYVVYNYEGKTFSESMCRRLEAFCKIRGLRRMSEYWRLEAFAANRRVNEKGGRR